MPLTFRLSSVDCASWQRLLEFPSCLLATWIWHKECEQCSSCSQIGDIFFAVAGSTLDCFQCIIVSAFAGHINNIWLRHPCSACVLEDPCSRIADVWVLSTNTAIDWTPQHHKCPIATQNTNNVFSKGGVRCIGGYPLSWHSMWYYFHWPTNMRFTHYTCARLTICTTTKRQLFTWIVRLGWLCAGL